ncbi:MAG TPA: hypothetical protein PKA06_16415, partial [Gemmatales bacterium]|nr:hypothetical protein [Gemmatales bacterium]
MELLSSQHFPERFQGNLLVLNVIGYQGILMYKLRDEGASIVGEENVRLLSSSDPNFRPSDIKIGPGGAIYFCDWHNPIIGHMQHNLRDPNRNRTHGRVYRITYEGRPLSQKVKIDGEESARLFELLQHPEERVRYHTRKELACRPSSEVLKLVSEWAGTNDEKLLEALWLHQAHHQVNPVLLQKCLASNIPQVRAAAIRVLSHWRDSYKNTSHSSSSSDSQETRQATPDTQTSIKEGELYANIKKSHSNASPADFSGHAEILSILHRHANDQDPRVRLEVARAASFLDVPEAIEIPLLVHASRYGSDKYIEFVCQETRKTLEPRWKSSLARGHQFRMQTSLGKEFLVKNMSTPALLKRERDALVCRELLT